MCQKIGEYTRLGVNVVNLSFCVSSLTSLKLSTNNHRPYFLLSCSVDPCVPVSPLNGFLCSASGIIILLNFERKLKVCVFLLQCLNSSGNDIGKCQFYMDMLSDCRRSSGSMMSS